MRKLITALVVLFSISAHSQVSLVTGNPTPQLKNLKWLQGAPVESFKPGQIYIVEFWGTWCGPCIDSIPHLNEIAKKYAGKVQIISVAAREQGATAEEKLATLNSFLAKGDPAFSKDITLAFDGTDETNQQWLKAAEVRGIPSSFVIDGEGKIAFIGHPVLLGHESLGNPLDQIVKGTWHNSDARKKMDQETAEEKHAQQAYEGLLDRLETAKENSRWSEVVVIAREGLKLPEGYHAQFKLIEAETLITQMAKPREGLAILRELVSDAYNSPQFLGLILDLMVHEKVGSNLHDHGMARPLAERVLELVNQHPNANYREKFRKYRWMLLPPAARYYFVLGQFDKAVDIQQDAVSGLTEEYADERAELEAKLKHYQEFAGINKAAGQPVLLECKDGVCEMPPTPCEKTLNGDAK